VDHGSIRSLTGEEFHRRRWWAFTTVDSILYQAFVTPVFKRFRMHDTVAVLKRFRNLSRAERRDLWPAVWRLSCVWCLLPVLGVERSRSWLSSLQRRPGYGSDGQPDLQVWSRRAQALKRVGGRMPGVHCLARSLCLWWWMRGAGLDPALEIGVRRDGHDAVLSHSWVECDGVPVDETPEVVARFRPLRWPDAAGRGASSR